MTISFVDAGHKIKGKLKKRKKKRRGLKLKPNEKVMRKLPDPRKVVAEYKKALTQATKLTRGEVMAQYAELSLVQFSAQLDKIYEVMPWWEKTQDVSTQVVNETNETHQAAFYKSVDEAVGTSMKRFINEQGLDDILQTSIAENVEMITDLTATSQRRVASIVNRAIMEGSAKKGSLEKQLLQGFTTDAKKARFIARDQTQRLYKNLNQFRQERAGIEKYKWRTSRDVRVRQTHKDNNNKIFRWDKPPVETGHPGHDYNCRCFAQAIIEVIPA